LQAGIAVSAIPERQGSDAVLKIYAHAWKGLVPLVPPVLAFCISALLGMPFLLLRHEVRQ
jgi:hypothetical protein